MKIYRRKLAIVTLLVVALLALSVSVAAASGGGGGGAYHTVQRGETLFSIGRLYDAHPYRIAEVNNLWNPDCIYAGQVLYIPASDGGGYPWGGHDQCGYGNCYGNNYGSQHGYYPGHNYGCGYGNCYGQGWDYSQCDSGYCKQGRPQQYDSYQKW